jgi:hypothetical protein
VPRISPWVWRAAGAVASVAIVVAVVVEVGLFNQLVQFHLPVHASSFNCLPSEFPAYRNLTISSADYTFGNPAPDDTTSCRMTLNSYDGFAAVAAFYRQAMNSGRWTTTAVLDQPRSSVDLTFHLRERPATHGWVVVQNQAISTQVMVNLFS